MTGRRAWATPMSCRRASSCPSRCSVSSDWWWWSRRWCGGHGLEMRVQVILIGVAGTMLLNLVRVALVALIAATVGVGPAIFFHDYGGTVLFVGFLFAFWAFAQRWILAPVLLEGEATV